MSAIATTLRKKTTPVALAQRTPPQPTHAEIAVCAHAIWELEGRPQGREVTHWLQAEQQLRLAGKQDARLV
jgi:hypothetical protein